MNKNMQISQDGIDLIKRFEGLRLDAYQDSAGVWTIGYGSTLRVEKGASIDEPAADRLLRLDVQRHEKFVQDSVGVTLKQHEYDALVSLVFNIGGSAFKKSSLLAALNKGNYAEAAFQFCVWNKVGDDRSIGLLRRRMAEASMFIGYAMDEHLAAKLRHMRVDIGNPSTASEQPANACAYRVCVEFEELSQEHIKGLILDPDFVKIDRTGGCLSSGLTTEITRKGKDYGEVMQSVSDKIDSIMEAHPNIRIACVTKHSMN